jgi:hypothetical protein
MANWTYILQKSMSTGRVDFLKEVVKWLLNHVRDSPETLQMAISTGDGQMVGAVLHRVSDTNWESSIQACIDAGSPQLLSKALIGQNYRMDWVKMVPITILREVLRNSRHVDWDWLGMIAVAMESSDENILEEVLQRAFANKDMMAPIEVVI